MIVLCKPTFQADTPFISQHGVKGMKWGHHIKRAITPTIHTKNGYVSVAQKSTAPAEDLFKSTKQLASTHYRYKDKSTKEKREAKFKKKSKLDKYSDKELQDYLNRARLEKQVMDISMPEIKDGRDKLQRNLDILTTTVSIAGSLATIYATVHQPTSKKTYNKEVSPDTPLMKGFKMNNKKNIFKEYKQSSTAFPNSNFSPVNMYKQVNGNMYLPKSSSKPVNMYNQIINKKKG